MLVHRQMMVHTTTHSVPCLASTHIEFAIIKHDGNSIVIAMGSCNVFRKLTDPFFVVIVLVAQDITHLISSRAHLRMRSTTLWSLRYHPVALLHVTQWLHHCITPIAENLNKRFIH